MVQQGGERMFDGQRLPMHPALFMPLFWTFGFFLEIWAEVTGRPLLAFLLSTPGCALYFGWAWQAGHYSLKVSGEENIGCIRADQWRRIMKIAVLVVSFVWLAALAKGLSIQAAIDGPVIHIVGPFIDALMAFCGVGFALTLFWFAAKSLDVAEGGDVSDWPIGTFLFFFYSPAFGAPFLFKRLRQLGLVKSESDLRTA